MYFSCIIKKKEGGKLDNKNIFASNLNRYMKQKNKSRREVADAIGVSYYTFTSWVTGKKYPRMDKVEMLAEFFGILKSDLIEEKVTTETSQKIDLATDIIIRMEKDSDFSELVQILYKLDGTKIAAFKTLLNSFLE